MNDREEAVNLIKDKLSGLKDDIVYVMFDICYDHRADINFIAVGHRKEIISAVERHADMCCSALETAKDTLEDEGIVVEPVRFYNMTDKPLDTVRSVFELEYIDGVHGSNHIAIIDTGIKHKGE